MGRSCFPKCKLARIMGWIQIILGWLVILVSLLSLTRFYSAGFFVHNEGICQHFYNVRDVSDGFDVKSLSDRVGEVIDKLETLQAKLESKVDEGMKSAVKEDHVINFFITEEIRKYISPKENRVGKINLYGADKVYNTIGHACVLYKKELEKYMDYDIGSYCDDDWNLAQKLMLNGCDPLPRRRCLTRASKDYQKPHPIHESLWRLPDRRNVRWGNYQCRNFECLSSQNPKRGYSKCIGCFEMEKEKLKWASNTSLVVDFLISDVLAIKPGEVRIGLDYGIGSGTFAARMREQNVTIVSTALNLGAPSNEIS
ncbi:hypothetical protein JHK87_000764 [Glycine soja]|nr:hypothetical protein JHK87_000764 [Glycine soja]